MREELEHSLKGYKEKIVPVTKATLTWDRDLIFVGRTQQGYEMEFDAHVQWGCKPTDALLLSLAGCMGIDVVMFLQKMRVQLAGFSMDITGERNPDPPQYYRSIDILLHIAGKGLVPKKMDRAISLSHEKYCSVYNSLRKDIAMKVRYELQEKEPAPRLRKSEEEGLRPLAHLQGSPMTGIISATTTEADDITGALAPGEPHILQSKRF